MHDGGVRVQHETPATRAGVETRGDLEVHLRPGAAEALRQGECLALEGHVRGLEHIDVTDQATRAVMIADELAPGADEPDVVRPGEVVGELDDVAPTEPADGR